MRTAVVSDIHGNVAALEAVVADAESRGCSAFVNLGDILSGPLWPRETAEYLMARDWATIAGNHERQLLNDPPERIGPSDRYTREALDQRHIEWLRSLPATWQLSADVFLCHGTPTSDLTYFLEKADESGIRGATRDEVRERAAGRPELLILCGHTHVARLIELGDGRSVANPGSIGLQAYESDHPRLHIVENGSPLAR